MSVAIEPRLFHWFLLPTVGCGLLLGADAGRWLGGRLEPFDPKGIVAVVGIHLFVIAPVLVVWWEFDYDVMRRPDDWRPWIGVMSLLNLLGLAAFRLTSGIAISSRRRRRRVTTWVLSEKRALPILVVTLVLGGLAQAYVWWRVGGIAGGPEIDREDVRVSFGIRTFANAFPLLLVVLATFLARRRDREHGKYSVAFAVLGVTFVLYFVGDGLRGSRSSVVFTLFWTAGIVHYFWKRLSARWLIVGVVPMAVFMYLYSFYKVYGTDVLRQYEMQGSVSNLSENSGRTFGHLVIRDLSRADVQAYLVFLLSKHDADYEPQNGRTYLEALGRSALPSWIWRGRPKLSAKSLAGTKLHFGIETGLYGRPLSKVYGLGGEAILNFGLWGVVPAYAIVGLLLGFYRRYYATWHARDARLFLAPFACILFLGLIAGDLDNVVAAIMGKLIVPLAILLLIAERRRESPVHD